MRNLTNGTPVPVQPAWRATCATRRPRATSSRSSIPTVPTGASRGGATRRQPPAHSGGWDYYDPWVWTSWFPMIEPSAATHPVDVRHRQPRARAVLHAWSPPTPRPSPTTNPIGYGGLVKRLDLPTTGPSACPSVYSFTLRQRRDHQRGRQRSELGDPGPASTTAAARRPRWLEDQLASWRS